MILSIFDVVTDVARYHAVWLVNAYLDYAQTVTKDNKYGFPRIARTVS